MWGHAPFRCAEIFANKQAKTGFSPLCCLYKMYQVLQNVAGMLIEGKRCAEFLALYQLHIQHYSENLIKLAIYLIETT